MLRLKYSTYSNYSFEFTIIILVADGNHNDDKHGDTVVAAAAAAAADDDVDNNGNEIIYNSFKFERINDYGVEHYNKNHFQMVFGLISGCLLTSDPQ